MINCIVSITQLMFETFDAGAVYVANTASLTAFSSGTLDGVVFECGYDTSYITPVYDGICLRFATPKVKCFSCPKQWRIQGGRQGHAPSRSKFFHFYAVLAKNLQNNRSAHPARELAPPGKSWIRHCKDLLTFRQNKFNLRKNAMPFRGDRNTIKIPFSLVSK